MQISVKSDPTLVVSGSIHYDLILQLPHLPGENDRIAPTAMTLAPGGMGGNVAATAARLGGNVRFVGQFADNADGQELRADLIRDGVDTQWAGIRSVTTAHRGMILVGEKGQRAILGSWPEASALERAPGQAPGFVRELVTTGSPLNAASRYSLSPIEIDPRAFHGENVAFACPFNFAPLVLHNVPASIPVYMDIETGHVAGWSEDDILRTLKRATVVYGNQRNLADLVRRLDEPSVTSLSRTLRGTIVETAGELGCLIHETGNRIVVTGFPVTSVDSTGAGDCFAAACTLALRRGDLITTAARFGNAAAALSIQRLGSRPGVPTRSEIDTFLTAKSVADSETPVSVRSRLLGFVSSTLRSPTVANEIQSARNDMRDSSPSELFSQSVMDR